MFLRVQGESKSLCSQLGEDWRQERAGEAPWDWEGQHQCPRWPSFSSLQGSRPPSCHPSASCLWFSLLSVLLKPPRAGAASQKAFEATGRVMVSSGHLQGHLEHLMPKENPCSCGQLQHPHSRGHSDPLHASHPGGCQRGLFCGHLSFTPLLYAGTAPPMVRELSPTPLAWLPDPGLRLRLCVCGCVRGPTCHYQPVTVSPSAGQPGLPSTSITQGTLTPPDPRDPRLGSHLFPGTSL